MQENNKKIIAYTVISLVLLLSVGLVYFIFYITSEYNKLNTQETVSESLDQSVFEWGATPDDFFEIRRDIPTVAMGVEVVGSSQVITEDTDEIIDSSQGDVPFSVQTQIQSTRLQTSETLPQNSNVTDSAVSSNDSSDVTSSDNDTFTPNNFGIEVTNISVRDIDAEGEIISWTGRGTIIGLDSNRRTFIISRENGNNESFTIRTTDSTDFLVGSSKINFFGLVVGDVVEINGETTSTSLEINAKSVSVVGKIRLFDDGQ
jgi:hypothetical protein